jgi:hypothetical protein
VVHLENVDFADSVPGHALTQVLRKFEDLQLTGLALAPFELSVHDFAVSSNTLLELSPLSTQATLGFAG